MNAKEVDLAAVLGPVGIVWRSGSEAGGSDDHQHSKAVLRANVQISDAQINRNAGYEGDQLLSLGHSHANMPVLHVARRLESPAQAKLQNTSFRERKFAKEALPFEKVPRVVEAEGGIGIFDIVVRQEAVDFLELMEANEL